MTKNIQKNNIYTSEEERTLNWIDIQSLLKRHLVVKFIIVGYKKFH